LAGAAAGPAAAGGGLRWPAWTTNEPHAPVDTRLTPLWSSKPYARRLLSADGADHPCHSLGRKQRDRINQTTTSSREHAEITFDGVNFLITDKNSTHHTYVDGNMIRPGEPTQIDSGATIRLGTTTSMKFQVEGYYGDSGNAEPGATRFS
jgi:hypothetical protein